jgi:hypothetical protein
MPAWFRTRVVDGRKMFVELLEDGRLILEPERDKLDDRGDRSRSKGGVVRIIAPMRMTPSAEAGDVHDHAGAGERKPIRGPLVRVAGR